MLDKILETESLSIVFLGDFNPVIITPSWLYSKGLIREEESKNAKIEVIHPEFVKFSLDWLDIEITRTRCSFNTSKSPYFDLGRDLVSSIFSVLAETPVRSFGINHIFDLRLKSEEKYYDFGKKLTNFDVFGDDLNDPRLINIEFLESARRNGLDGRYRVRIQSTGPEVKYGVSISINDHYEIGKNVNCVGLFTDQWNNSFERSREVVTNLINRISI